MTDFRVILSSLLLLLFFPLSGQRFDPDLIKQKIAAYKEDPRGPYQDIRWYCKDGSVIPPKESCPEPGGVQRARYKEEVIDLAKDHHLYFGQILATTEINDFWDAEYRQSRLKQYMLEQYLRAVDDGWTNQKAQYYRGAYQIEDEKAWGQDFLKRMLDDEEKIKGHFFLLRQATKVIPHREDNDRAQRIRTVSKVIAEEIEAFMPLRVKIHGQPSKADIKSVKEFKTKNPGKLNTKTSKLFDQLVDDLELFYADFDYSEVDDYLRQISDSELKSKLTQLAARWENKLPVAEKAEIISDMILAIRTDLASVSSRTSRLVALDLSLALEEELFKLTNAWETPTVAEIASKIYALAKALAGTGFLEVWEWEAIRSQLAQVPAADDSDQWKSYLDKSRGIIEWSANMSRAVFGDVVDLYQAFEPKAYGYLDDIIRGSVLLPAGQAVAELGESLAKDQDTRNYLLGYEQVSNARGLNPGTAMGELVVLRTATEDMEVDKNKIYVFDRPPSDLKPVAGIATVSEGNMVSHVQLLARNLAIPNAVISSDQLEFLSAYSGKMVYYRVDKQGNVLLKMAEEMTEEEQSKFQQKERNLEKVSVPIDRINLAEKSVLDMRSVDAQSSGVLCGPKAANLGQLKKMFPGKVVEGLVIPFGIFRSHMDQPMPGQDESYWAFLEQTFDEAERQEKEKTSEANVEAYVLGRLATLRAAIEQMPLQQRFIADLEEKYETVLGDVIGRVPVFLRSDTNMEDLKDFTGAGLNLTLFNILDRSTILDGIKKVWASPYTERSFKWRQRYLLNPENVFPSILIIPSVDVDYSGVLITKGIQSDDDDDLTLAISRGAGGAVDGQAAESYLLEADGDNHLLTPAREPYYRRLPTSGGTTKLVTNFDSPITTPADLNKIRALAREVEQVFPSFSESTSGAYDIEFGFQDGKLWLFQIRPFVEQKEPSILSNSNESKSETPPSSGSTNNFWWVIGGLIIALGLIGGWIYFRNQSQTSKTV